MSYLITGGTGSLGKELIQKLKGEQIIVYSRDEGKQALLSDDIIKIIGDVKDLERLKFTIQLYKPQYVIHTAALKRINDIELCPEEAIKTNIIGSSNVIKACQGTVEKCILISTDKACSNINVYGSTKFIAERLFTNANFNSHNTQFGSVRYGNCLASRGSFLLLWYNKIKNLERVWITDKNCTRFLFSLSEASQFVLKSLHRMEGGEVFVPKLNSFYIIDVLNCLETIINKKAKYSIIGMRPGEKLHEDMLNEHELPYTYIEEDKLIILPQYGEHNYNYKTKYEGSPLNSALHVADKSILLEQLLDVL